MASLQFLWSARIRHHLSSFARQLQIHQQRSYSSRSGNKQNGSGYYEVHRIAGSAEAEGDRVGWRDPTRGLFEPEDPRVPLPGNVGIPVSLVEACHTQLPNVKEEPPVEILSEVQPQSVAESLQSPEGSKHETQILVIGQYLTSPLLFGDSVSFSSDSSVMSLVVEDMELAAFDCPQLLKKEFKDLFPSRDLNTSNLTLLTVTQRTVNDMAAWTEEMDEERERLTGHFITAARDICNTLTESGYWADFIDPSSGRPYMGPFTNATLFETDERYRYLGFSVEDVGCCKVIRHSRYDTKIFVGCIFTNAPLESAAFESIPLASSSGEDPDESKN